MPKKSAQILACFCVVILWFLNVSSVKAAVFNQASLTLDRLQASTATGGTVCANTPSAGVESSVSITFPTGFNVNTTASNWTISTTNLPSGATAWPGIGTATSVSSQTVTFPSGNLNTNTLYCFKFSGTNTLTTSTAGQKQGVVSTNLDSSDYGLEVISSDQIAVTALVGAGANDLQNTLISTTSGEVFPQNTPISFQITYGNASAIASDLTLQASWSQGTVEQESAPSVDLIHYSFGSASKAYGGTVPVIDTQNRTITWTIPNMPANTINQTVNFTLIIGEPYQGSSTVKFDVNSNLSTDTLTGAISTVTKRYKYQVIPPQPTPTPSTAPAATPAPKLLLNDVRLSQIASSSAIIKVDVNQEATLLVEYGKSLEKLDQKLEFLQFSNDHEVDLTGLDPNQVYYFKLTLVNQDGQKVVSDIFTFKTARLTDVRSVLRRESVVISSSKILMVPLDDDPEKPSTFVIPINAIIEFRFKLLNYKSIKDAQVFARDAEVLGINTVSAQENANTLNTNLFEIRPGEFLGKIRTETKSSLYDLVLKLSDLNGNLSEDTLFQIKVVKPVSVKEAQTQKSISNARIFLQFYNDRQKIFQDVSTDIIPIPNPFYTNSNGEADVVLPPGRYRAKVSALGFAEKDFEFEISKNNSKYPLFELEGKALSVTDYFNYYSTALFDTYSLSVQYLQSVSKHQILFNLSLFGSLLILVVLTLIAFLYKTHGSLRQFPKHLIYHLTAFFDKKRSESIIGKVVNEKGQPVNRVSVSLIGKHDNLVITDTFTNKFGEFYFPKVNFEDHRLLFIKKDYQPIIKIEDTSYFRGTDFVNVTLISKKSVKIPLLLTVKTLIQNSLSFSFELFLLISILAQTIYVSTFGLAKTLPLLLITTFNILLWLIYSKNSKQQIKV